MEGNKQPLDQSRKSCSGLSKSYYHHVDSRFPKCYLTLPELYKRTADMNTDKGITWHYPRVKMTYTQLYEEALKVAKGLLHAGIHRGDVVMSVGVDGPKSFILFMAASILGVLFAAPYFHPPIERNVRDTIAKLKPKLLLVGHAKMSWETRDCYTDVVNAITSDEITSNDFSRPIVVVDGKKDKEATGSDSAEKFESFGELIKAGEKISDEELNQHIALVTENEPCFYTPSSGTTGEPKWVVVGSSSLANTGLQRKACSQIDESWKTMSTNICTEEYAMLDFAMAAFYIGNEYIVLPTHPVYDAEPLAKNLLEILCGHRPNQCFADQYVTSYLVTHPELLDGYDVPPVSLAVAGSRTSPSFINSLLEKWPDSVQYYGLTESYDVATTSPGDMRRKPGTCGKLSINAEAKVVDEKRRCVPWESAGELWVRSDSHFLEYKDQPELTRSIKREDGWLKTGDLCKLDQDGYLYVLGRIKGAERFKVFADVVYAKVIEDVMSTMPGVKQIVAVGRETGTTDGHEICYCIEVLEGAELTTEAVCQFAVEKLYQSDEWPRRVFFYDKFPVHGARSKVSRNKLLEEVVEKVTADAKAGWANIEDY